MGIGRDELETLSRAELVHRAKAVGVSRAETLTRPELIDEIVSASVSDDKERRLARGLLGRARDLVARVVEKGLHLPDAAQRILTPVGLPPPNAPKPIATLALAQVYARQGHRTQALTVLDEVLRLDPHNTAALTLRENLSSPSRQEPNASAASESESAPDVEPKSATPGRMADGASAPTLDDSDEQVGTSSPCALPEGQAGIPTRDSIQVTGDRNRMQIAWRLRPVTFARGRARSPSGQLVVRVIHTLVSNQGPDVKQEDVEIDRLAGTLRITRPEGSLSSHVALGWRDGGMFLAVLTEPS
jgi:hypothetical protein